MTDPNVPNNEQPQTPPPAAAPVPPAAPYAQQAPYGAPAQKSPVLSIISLIAGILGLVLSWTGWVLLISVAAIVLGFLGKKKEPAAKGMWLTGLILGFVGAVIGLIFFIIQILALIFFASVAGSVSDLSTFSG